MQFQNLNSKKMYVQQILHKLLTAIGIRKEKYYLFRIEITEDILQSKPLVIGFDTVEITSDNISEYDFSLFGKKYGRFVERLSNPLYRLYAVVEGHKVCYYTWISFDEFIFPSYVKQRKQLQPDEAFLFDSACSDDYKGRGFHSFMNVFRLQKIFESGKKTALVFVLTSNVPAIKVQKKSGMRISKILKTFHCSWLGIDKVAFVDYENN